MPPNASAESAAWPPAPGDVDLHAVQRRDGPQLVGDGGHLVPALGAEVEGDAGLRDPTVLARPPGSRAARRWRG